MVKTTTNQNNPLTRFMRQPKIYITLPSRGNYWPVGSIDIPENGQLPVFSMTAKDEIVMKTPDALLNGQSVVDVIHSCVPNIKNAWSCPSIDLDMLLVAIRIATYGETMTVGYNIPVINEEGEYEIGLHSFIDQISNAQWIEQVPVNSDLIMFVKPLTYKHMTTISQKSFETNKMMQIANDNTISDDDKAAYITKSFKTLTDLTTDMLVGSIFKIKTVDEDVTETRYIKEFIENADKSIIDTIQKHLNDLKIQNDLKPVILNTTPEQQEAGAPATFEVPISFDQSNFFA
jgi:hypothetical protein